MSSDLYVDDGSHSILGVSYIKISLSIISWLLNNTDLTAAADPELGGDISDTISCTGLLDVVFVVEDVVDEVVVVVVVDVVLVDDVVGVWLISTSV